MVVPVVAELVASSTPYFTAAIGAYGTAVLTKVQGDAADATVNIGQRLLQRVFGVRKEHEALPAPLAQAVGAPGDADALGALRLAIRAALEADPAMLDEVRGILASGQVTVHAPRITSHRDTYYAGGDMTITRPADPPAPAVADDH
jgi:hypothetical protein